MDTKTILILGGYGNTGRLIAELLLQETDVTLVVAGRSLPRAEELARLLNESRPGNRVHAVYADAAQAHTLLEALQGVEMLVVASATTEYTKQVAEAALEAGADAFASKGDPPERLLRTMDKIAKGDTPCGL